MKKPALFACPPSLRPEKVPHHASNGHISATLSTQAAQKNMVVQQSRPPCPTCRQPWDDASDVLFLAQCRHHGVDLPAPLPSTDASNPAVQTPAAPPHILQQCCNRLVLADPDGRKTLQHGQGSQTDICFGHLPMTQQVARGTLNGHASDATRTRPCPFPRRPSPTHGPRAFFLDLRTGTGGGDVATHTQGVCQNKSQAHTSSQTRQATNQTQLARPAPTGHTVGHQHQTATPRQRTAGATYLYC